MKAGRASTGAIRTDGLASAAGQEPGIVGMAPRFDSLSADACGRERARAATAL